MKSVSNVKVDVSTMKIGHPTPTTAIIIYRFSTGKDQCVDPCEIETLEEIARNSSQLIISAKRPLPSTNLVKIHPREPSWWNVIFLWLFPTTREYARLFVDLLVGRAGTGKLEKKLWTNLYKIFRVDVEIVKWIGLVACVSHNLRHQIPNYTW